MSIGIWHPALADGLELEYWLQVSGISLWRETSASLYKDEETKEGDEETKGGPGYESECFAIDPDACLQ
ncbi:MAG: hypothetical protein AB1847_02425 [bacterium]